MSELDKTLERLDEQFADIHAKIAEINQGLREAKKE